MDNTAQSVHFDAVDENVHPAQVAPLVRTLLVVKRSEARGERLEIRVEVGDDG